jgi:hypothetical protein
VRWVVLGELAADVDKTRRGLFVPFAFTKLGCHQGRAMDKAQRSVVGVQSHGAPALGGEWAAGKAGKRMCSSSTVLLKRRWTPAGNDEWCRER